MKRPRKKKTEHIYSTDKDLRKPKKNKSNENKTRKTRDS